VADNESSKRSALKRRSKSVVALIDTTIDRAKLRRANTKKDSTKITPEKVIQGIPSRIIRPLPLKLIQQLEEFVSD